MKLADNVRIYQDEKTGNIIFDDGLEKLLLSQYFDEEQIFWGDHEGYMVRIREDFIPLDRYVL